ncbi:FAD/NAD(P)-binding domain-containing protein [Auricularia subglabra TFB-10046 SS5]|nr:FAD/NAD(P)-binding domain-containing protein [Auricularia subglabra TFB-10046 SS5]
MAQDGKKNIVVLGGSYGGVSTAHYLLKHAIPQLPDKENYRLVLVSPASQVMCRPACPRALIADHHFDQSKLFVDIAKQFEQYPAGTFRFVHAAATALGHTNEQLAYHALIIATGASTPSPLLGLNRDEAFLRESWAAFRKALPAAKSIVVAGGGPSGVETAGELGEHLNGRAGFFSSRLANPNVNITLVTADSKLLPHLRPSLAAKAEVLLAKVGVTVIKNTRVVSVTPEDSGQAGEHLPSKAAVTLSDGETLEADLYVPAIGMTPNTSFIDSSLLASDGRVAANSATFRVEGAGERVYAIGDASAAARPAVHNILGAVPVLGANVKRDLLLAAGKPADQVPKDREFIEDKRETQLVPIGRSKGVGSFMGWSQPSFFVWLIKGRDYWLWTTGNLWSGKQWAKEP